MTRVHRHTLSETTRSLVKSLGPLTITLYSEDIDKYHTTEILVQRYQHFQPTIIFNWQKSALTESTHSLHTLVLDYADHQQKIDISNRTINEALLTQALFKLQRQANNGWYFLKGHDEPSPFGNTNSDFSLLRLALENQGLKIQQLNLATTPFVPENTQVLIIAAPKTSLLPKEEELLANYIARGGDLLWLIDPGCAAIPLLHQTFGVYPLPGTIVDVKGQMLGTPHPAITVISQYPKTFTVVKTITAFPWASALKYTQRPQWQSEDLLITDKATWTEIGKLENNIAFEPEKGEIAGPLLLGLRLHRPHPVLKDKQQRIVIIGNSRFICNSAIENYGNLALGLHLVNWLSHDDALAPISYPVAQDTFYHFSPLIGFAIQYGYIAFILFLVVMFVGFFQHRSRLSNKIAAQLSRR